MFARMTVGGRGSPTVLVLGQFRGARAAKPLAKNDLARDPDGSVAAASKRPESSGELGAMAEAFPEAPKKTGRRKRGTKAAPSFERVLIAGLGSEDDLTPAALRRLGGAVGRRLASIKAEKVEIDLRSAIKQAGLDEALAMSALGEGLGLVGWSYDRLRGSATKKNDPKPLAVFAPTKAGEQGLTRGLGLAESANRARDLSQTPPNIANTDYIASEARKLAREVGLTCTIYKGKQLEDHGLVGIKTVGQASEHEGCLVRLEYTPARAGKRSKPAVLVGKTMTYDSGGLSIKVGGSMRGMKRDKDGGCAVFGAMHAIATVIKPKRRVVALLSVAENAISDEAYRPDDVLEFMNGVTVEVTNTDAEGRLVMADALCWACEHEDPAYVIDVATLTGGVVVALGSTYAGLWCDDDKLRGRLEAASEASDERLWRLPHHDEYREMMRSPIADIHNSAPVREAHPIQGAAFLSYFVESGVPWAHIDIAGTHATDKPKGPFMPGPTGFGTRLLAELLDGESS
ncbi:MAG: leucyl aminopeptidase family protein [Planctomycetota bacterium]